MMVRLGKASQGLPYWYVYFILLGWGRAWYAGKGIHMKIRSNFLLYFFIFNFPFHPICLVRDQCQSREGGASERA